MRDDRHFPIAMNKFRGIPLNSHPGAFGASRRFDYHEGVDLYGEEGDPVFAIEDGIVYSVWQFTGAPETPWWCSTQAIQVKNNRGWHWIYGEVHPLVKQMDEVKAGDLIGRIAAVLPKSKLRADIPGHSNAMLHLESWRHYDDAIQARGPWTEFDRRPVGLEDPTLELSYMARNNLKFLTL